RGPPGGLADLSSVGTGTAGVGRSLGGRPAAQVALVALPRPLSNGPRIESVKKENFMRTRLVQIAALLALVALTAYGPATARVDGAGETAASLSSVGPLTFAPDGTLYAADPLAASIYA